MGPDSTGNHADFFADEAMKAEVLPPLIDQPPIVADAVHTWTIEEWHSLPKKHHGPVFEAGGFPW